MYWLRESITKPQRYPLQSLNVKQGYWNKHTKKIVNTKAKSIIDDLGLGGTFPLPIGIHKEQMIGIINPFEVDIKQVKDKDLLSLLENMTEESNPLIIIYSLK